MIRNTKDICIYNGMIAFSATKNLYLWDVRCPYPYSVFQNEVR